MPNLPDYLSVELAFIIPALWIIGAFLKATPKVHNFLIIWILLVLGVIGGVATLGLNAEGITQGVIASGLAVFGHQLVKQTVRSY